MSDQYTPTGGQTIFPRINFLKTFSSRLEQRISNGRVAMFFKRLFGDATLDLNFASTKSIGDLVTFTRASSATYVGSDGLIKTSPVNLLTYSDALSGWSLSNTTRAVSSTNPPFGSGNASSFTATGGNAVYPYSGIASPSPSGTYTFTIYTTFTQSFSFLGYGTGFGLLVLFDVDTKQPSTVTLNPGTNATNINSSVTSEEGGWYKIQVTFTTTGVVTEATVALNKNKVTAWGLSNSSVVGDTLALFGAQLEEGTTATDYIPTTSVATGAPRFDHDPVTLESLGLLIEEERTNLVPNSIVTAANGWTVNNINETPNATTAPDGTLTATEYTLTESSNPNTRRVFRFFTTSSLADTVTIFVKAGGTDQLFMRGLRNNGIVKINLTSGVVTDNTSVSIVTTTPYANGWWRITLTDSSSNPIVYLSIPTGVSAGGSFYVWGAQLEAGSFPTSYIPTDGTPGGVTRAPDLASIEGTNFSSWYNQSEGSFFIDFNGLGTTASARIIGTNGVPTPIYWSNTTIRSYGLNAGPIIVADDSIPSKAALSYSTTIPEDTLCINGTSLSTAGGFNTASNATTTVYLFGTFGIPNTVGHISRFAYFPTRKTAQELIDLTK